MTLQAIEHEMKPLQLVIAAICLAAAFAMAHAVDMGITAEWLPWQRKLWGGTMLVGILTGVFLAISALGLVTTESLNDRSVEVVPQGRQLTALRYGSVYVGSLLAMFALAMAVEKLLNVPIERALLAVGGGLFIAAASGRPWWLYHTIRRLGWFAAIPGPGPMRALLALLGLGLLFGAFLSR